MAKKKETKKIEEALVVTDEQPVEEKKPNRLGDLISRIEDRYWASYLKASFLIWRLLWRLKKGIEVS